MLTAANMSTVNENQLNKEDPLNPNASNIKKPTSGMPLFAISPVRNKYKLTRAQAPAPNKAILYINFISNCSKEYLLDHLDRKLHFLLEGSIHK